MRGAAVSEEWDVAIVGAGPAGLSAAASAARAGAKTIVLERAVHPRYKTCGGGLIGTSLKALGLDLPLSGQALPVREQVDAATFTLRGKHMFTRQRDDVLLAMVLREEFDDMLRKVAIEAGAVVREHAMVRSVLQDADQAGAKLADGSEVQAKVIVGADGSAGVTAKYVGVEFAQVDLGLEVEVAAPEPVQQEWRGRILIDWGPIPSSYGWVFPKADRLTVGIIAPKGTSEQAKKYLRTFVDRLGLASYPYIYDSGHLTRCRSASSPLRRGRILVAGDAAGLLEPWTREGISFALRSGALAGGSAAKASRAEGGSATTEALDEYVEAVHQRLGPEMEAGRRVLAAFTRHPGVVHAGLATSTGWRVFSKFCRGELALPALTDRPLLGMAISMMGRT
jgi:geranylgeranyl reductase family protein